MALKKPELPIYYLAVLMPNSGRGANNVRYYWASKDLRRLFQVEQKLNPKGWKQSFLESLLVVPKRQYHYPLHLGNEVIMASLAKVIGITNSPPKFIIAVSKAQFVLAKDWTTPSAPLNYITFVKHDYNQSTQKKLTLDWQYWRQPNVRQFALKLYQQIQNTV